MAKQRHEHLRFQHNTPMYGVHICKYCGMDYCPPPGSKPDFCDLKQLKKKRLEQEKITKAKFIDVTEVHGRGGNAGKFRWECPKCRENKAVECRFNLVRNKINIEWPCRFCGTELFLKK
ncbi:hypothetical protein LCGC14_3041110 [marine sediment metagenome]|uniref:Uncharacterized protein n=1 Tax=marine sediment metagenome TaxID=412755 RepID=A0A0F8ZFH3_9ZZZZ